MYKKSDRIALFISVLLHSLLVFFPREEEPLHSAESSPPTGSISVVELPTLPAPESQSLPAVPHPAAVSPSLPAPTVPSRPPLATVPSNPPAPAVPSSPPAAIPVDPPTDLPPDDPSPETSSSPTEQPDPDPTADLPPEDPSPETSSSLTEQPESEPVPETDLPPEDPSTETNDEAKIAADWENLVGHLQSQDQGFASFPLLDIFNFFGEPEQTNQFFDENNQPKLDVSSFYLFPEQTPEQVLNTVVMPELTSNTGFELQLQENVSVGLTYQLSQGEMLRYLIIVQLNERSGSLLMFSDSLLGLES